MHFWALFSQAIGGPRPRGGGGSFALVFLRPMSLDREGDKLGSIAHYFLRPVFLDREGDKLGSIAHYFLRPVFLNRRCTMLLDQALRISGGHRLSRLYVHRVCAFSERNG